MQTARRVAALSIAAIAVLGVAACSSNDTPKLTASDDNASDGTLTSEPADISSGDLTADNFVSRLATASKKAGTLSMSIQQPGSGVDTLSWEVDSIFTEASQDWSILSPGGSDGSMKVLIVDSIEYIWVPTAGKFVKEDPAYPYNKTHLGLLELFDPTMMVSFSDGAVTSLKKIGNPVELDGVQVQQYEVIVDSAKLTENAFSQIAADLSATSGKLTYQYWIDKNDLKRKVVLKISRDVITTTFSNWGADLAIVAPSEDQLIVL